MTTLENRIAELRRTAYSATTPGEVRNFLLSLERGAPNLDIPVEVAAELRFLAFTTLKQVTSVDPKEAYDVLLNELVPWSLMSYSRSGKAKFHVFRCRELLGKWINELSSEDLQNVLPKIIANLVGRLEGRTFKQACWSLGRIGYRDADLLNRLAEIVGQNPNKAGDHALALLIDLGLRPEELEEYTGNVLQRFRLRKDDTTFYLLQVAASRVVLNELETFVKSGEQTEKSDHTWLLGIIARIAEFLPDDPAASDQAAALIRRIFEHEPKEIAPRLAIASNILPAIDSPLVGRIFSDLFLSLKERPNERLHAIYVQSLRMRESTRPRQLEGMPAVYSVPLRDFLRSVLLLENKNMGPNGSLLIDTKKGALWTALALESADALKWLPDILDGEQNGYVQRDLMEAYACFRIDPLPRKITGWISEVYNAEKSGDVATWIVRTSALRVARSAATEEALAALLIPGFTLGDTVLLDTVQALTDTVLALTTQESRRAGIAEILLDTLASSKKGPRRSAAVDAIGALASVGRLPKDYHKRLNEAAFEEGLEDFEQSQLLSAVVSAEVNLSHPDIDKLVDWATGRHDRAGETALQSLIHLNRLPLNTLILARLGIWKSEGILRWGGGTQKMSRWAPYYVGLLFEKSETEFLPALLDVVRSGDWQQSAQVYGILNRIASVAGKELPAEVRTAVVDRLAKSISSSNAELGLFVTAARVAPEEFTTREWQEDLDEWFVDARIEFAEGLRRSVQKQISSEAKRSGMKYLIHLAEDSQYGVRRSAYRALAEVDESALLGLINAWQGARQHEARTWAAEAAGWINLEFYKGNKASEVMCRLHLDVHKNVRRTLADAMSSRRQRLWAENYLRRVDQLQNPSNPEMLAVWRYGWALARLGNDDVLDELQTIKDDNNRAPNVRHFASLLYKETEKQWNETRKKWPDPIFPIKGRVETGAGVIVVDYKHWDVEYILWGEPAKHPGDYSSWGGNCRLVNTPTDDRFFGREGEIRIEGGRTGKGFVQSWSNLSDLVFCGSGEYPS